MSRRHVYNITFHGIEPTKALGDGEERFWLPADEFRKVLDILDGRDDVFLTFDDGNRSDVAIVLPELLARGRTAAFFVPAARLGQPGFLDAADLRALVDAGMIVGSHGLLHRAWTSLDEAALDEELARSKDVLSLAAGREVDQAACPYGRYNRLVLRRLKALGYKRVYTSDSVKANPTAWLQPRTSFRRDDDVASAIRRLERRQRPRELLRRRVDSLALYARLPARKSGR